MKAQHAIHPYCDLFPDLSAEELKELAKDIEANGQHMPIWRWNKQILDGKNRWRACQIAGVTPLFEEWHPSKPSDKNKSDAEARDFALSLNLKRRHLTTSQRAMIAAGLAGLSNGQHGSLANLPSLSTAAEDLKVSVRSVTTAKNVLANGSAALVDAVKNGEVTITDAAAVVDQPKSAQTAAVVEVRKGRAKKVADAVEREPGDETENDATAPKAEVKTVSERAADQSKLLESFCRSVSKFFDDNLPEDAWLDESQVEIAKSQLKSCLGAIRVAKACDKPCPKCGGTGCKSCRQRGYLPKLQYEMLGGQ